MGSKQSARQSDFQRPDEDTLAASAEKISDQEEFNDNQDHHISISNKMVERLVEDAALEGGAAAAVAAVGGHDDAISRVEARDRVYTEKLRKLDDVHSEKCGLTIEEANALARRVELRAAIILAPSPVCKDCEEQVIECYSSGDPATASPEPFRCWSTVEAFRACVAEACATRLRARTAREAREQARRSLQVSHAREHSLRELRNKPDVPI